MRLRAESAALSPLAIPRAGDRVCRRIDRSRHGSQAEGREDQINVERYQPQPAAQGARPMAGKGDLEFVCGSGNVFRDFGHPSADVAATLRAGDLAE